MANISERRNAKGEITSYRIRVSRGYDAQGNKLRPYEMTWKPAKGMTKRQVEKELNRQALLFEEQCRLGLAGDGKQKFSEYADYVLELKEQSGELRHHTVVRYRNLLKRVNEGIGHMKLCDIRPQHLNLFYEQISKAGIRLTASKATLKPGVSLPDLIHGKGYGVVEVFVREQAKMSVSTYNKILKGNKARAESAKKLTDALGIDLEDLFDIEHDDRPLSPKTVREHHILIHLILRQAERELIIPYNPADKATPPKAEKPKANYFEQEEITAILQAAEDIPLKWRMMIHLLLVTGGRRGEVVGLTWSNVDFTFGRIFIDKTVNYESDSGLYIDKPKTASSVRYIKLPDQTMKMLEQYRKEYYLPLRTVCGDAWKGLKTNEGELIDDFLFVKDSGEKVGEPMHPDSITGYCDEFSSRYGLKHINPHAFRHSAASLLYFAGMDMISISGYLGHASPSTTQNLYAHVIAEAQSRIASAMGDIIVTSKVKRNDDSVTEIKQEKAGI